MSDDVDALLDVAEIAARNAGAFIRSTRPTNVTHKAGGHTLASQVVTDVDRQAEAIILETLEPTLAPSSIAILSEETLDDGGRHRKPRFWCIDPLDGTLPYIEGHPGYAVSIGLVSQSGEALGGVVYAPATDTLFRAAKGGRPTRNGQAWPAVVAPHISSANAQELVAFVDRSFQASADRTVVEQVLASAALASGANGVELKEGAGGVLNGCGVIDDAPACYLKLPKSVAGGGSVWDFAASACLVEAAGGVATDAAGAPLDLNRKDSTFMNHRGVLFASSAQIHAQILSALAHVDPRPS